MPDLASAHGENIASAQQFGAIMGTAANRLRQRDDGTHPKCREVVIDDMMVGCAQW